MNVLQPFSDSKGKRIGYSFWCPGCEGYHGVWVYRSNDYTGAIWSFNENMEKPTFSPSILLRSGHYDPEHNGDECWCTYNKNHPNDKPVFECTICHSFIENGNIRFLNDCTHKLAGKTVPLKPDE